jgi:calcium-dependent protein kinase
VCHRDLKPENILIDDKDKNTIKLIDFGTSQPFANEEKMELVLGTAYYIAPEVLQGNYDEKCDLWSIGVILYILLSGIPPFPGQTDEEIMQKVRKSALMNVKPEERLSAKQALEHDWIQQRVGSQQIDEKVASEAFANLSHFRVRSEGPSFNYLIGRIKVAAGGPNVHCLPDV